MRIIGLSTLTQSEFVAHINSCKDIYELWEFIENNYLPISVPSMYADVARTLHNVDVEIITK